MKTMDVIYRLFTLSLMSLVLISCKKNETIQSSNSTPDPQKETFILSFRVTCTDDGTMNGTVNPVLCNVSVFDVKTRTRLVRGSNTPDGWFDSFYRFSKDDLIRVELWDFNNRCIMWASNISLGSSPQIFVKSIENPRTNINPNNMGHFGLGKCMNEYPDATDAWGP